MKRTLTLALALAASISLVGCQPSEEQGSQTTTASPAAETPASPSAEATGEATTQAAAGGAGDAAAGQQIYATNCATCHGEAGMGDGPAASALNPKPTNLVEGPYKHDGKWAEVVKNGVPGTAMAPWSGTLSDEQVASVVAYAESIKK